MTTLGVLGALGERNKKIPQRTILAGEVINGIDAEQVRMQVHQEAAAVIEVHHGPVQDPDIAFFAQRVEIPDRAVMNIRCVIPLVR